MERLTIDEAIAHAKDVAGKKYNEGFLCHANPDDCKLDECVKCAQEHEQLAEWLTQLKEYQQLEEQGRLVKLPCKVGDTVYKIDRVSGKIKQHKVIHFEIERVDFDNYDYCFLHHFGKTVFLSEEEAEAKLKELQNN